MNNLQHFSAESAKSFSDIAAKRRNEKIVKLANKYIGAISNQYESKIKKELSNNPRCTEVQIGLGFTQPKKGDFDDVEKIVHDHFSKLGFNVILMKGKKCDCCFNFICNHNQTIAVIRW